MLEAISHVFQLLLNMVCEVLIYVFVDIITKNTLRDTSDVSEKRTIWLFEFGVLTVLGTIVWLFHHTPYLLGLLTFLTLAYTQLLERVNFRYWWLRVWTNWEEWEQHEESMGRLNEMRHQQMNQSYTSHNGRWPMPQPQPPPPQPPPPPPTYVSYDPASMSPSEAWYPADSNKGPSMIPFSEAPMAYTQTMPSPRHRPGMVLTPPPGYSHSHQMPEYVVHHAQRPTTYTYGQHTMVRPRELARRPLHAHVQSPKPSPQQNTLKSRVMSALGMKTQSNLPAGLKNNGENICFINSVLQCLAHSPSLANGLSQNEENANATSAQVALVTAVTDILQNLACVPGTSTLSVTNIDKIRQACSAIPGSMVSHPKHVQHQQDSAEFLMWLLDVLHSTLNIAGKANDAAQNQGANASMPWITPRYSSVTLSMLRFIYGDLTPEKISELKAACRKEMEMAGGLDVEGYAEAVQRLSDLEWLTYKEKSQSVVDDLFTGQLVEALHCTACSRLTVDIQTFNILPVPIEKPRSLNGLVYLEDCLAKFGKIEELYGPDGLQCDCCNRKENIADGQSASQGGYSTPSSRPVYANGITRIRIGGTVRQRKFTSVDSAIYSPSSVVSPIARGEVFNDSGFQDHMGTVPGQRTSTPIHAVNVPPMKLTDGQQRTLLRQVPKCLVIQLMRYTYDGGQPIKLHRPVVLPLNGLDLTPQIVDTVIQRPDTPAPPPASNRYDLYGLCLHLGADITASGHYIAYGRLSDGTWYRYDDDHVTPVNMEYELSTRQVRENAYLAFYRRVNQS